MKQATIEDRIIKTQNIRWKDLRFIQQDNFKEWVKDGDSKLIESILKYQFIDPFKVWENEGIIYCLDGKHRFLDLEKVTELGHDVPEMLPATFINCENMTEAAELVLIYSSNYAKITQQGLYDFVQNFNLSVHDMKSVINIPEFSFDQFDKKFDQFNIDDVPAELPKDIIVKEGDIFEINGHRIICGDSTSEKCLDQLMDGKTINSVVTSPPYNMNSELYAEYSDNLGQEQYLKMNVDVVSNALRYLKGFLFYNISYNKNSRADFIDILHFLKNIKGAEFLELIVWNKKAAIPITSDEMLTRNYEQIAMICTDDVFFDMEIFFLGTNQRKFYFNKRIGRTMTNYWEIPVNTHKVQFDNHSACFPVELPARAIQLTTKKEEIVFDPFLGMGTTLIASDGLNRLCYGIEQQPIYVQSAINRYLKYCNFNGISTNFAHVNGTLTLQDFLNEQSKLSNSN